VRALFHLCSPYRLQASVSILQQSLRLRTPTVAVDEAVVEASTAVAREVVLRAPA
jgi:hypothetical protein